MAVVVPTDKVWKRDGDPDPRVFSFLLPADAARSSADTLHYRLYVGRSCFFVFFFEEGILVEVKTLIGNLPDSFVSLSGGHRLSEEAEEARRPDEQAYGRAGARHQE